MRKTESPISAQTNPIEIRSACRSVILSNANWNTRNSPNSGAIDERDSRSASGKASAKDEKNEEC